MYSSGSPIAHKTQRLIYNYVSDNPGVTFSRLRKLLDLNTSTLRYHLDQLERAGRIVSRVVGKKRCLYSSDAADAVVSPKRDVVISNLNKNQKHLFKVIEKNPGMNQKELARLTRIERRLVSYSLKVLEEKELVMVEVADGVKTYEVFSEEKLKAQRYRELMVMLLEGEITEDEFNRLFEGVEDGSEQ